ncbi:TPA: hypothetical protein N0F65_001629, partial [Lagenidium giganteum]
VAARTITKQVLESTIEAILVKAGIGKSREAPAPPPQSPGAQMLHYYDGKFHLLPKSFEFLSVGPFGAWNWVVWRSCARISAAEAYSCD